MHVIFRFSLVILLAVVLGGCILPFRFEGTSMLPTIADGQRLLVSTSVSSIERGDILLFKYPLDPQRRYVKRVIGIPGETVSIDEGVVYINGQPLVEGYVDNTYNNATRKYDAVTIPPDQYFVMGDNRDNSSDSRIWGFVDKQMIEGKLYTTY
jgi:signal peptidase I